MATKKTIENLSLATEFKVKGYDKPLRIDFSDKRVINKLLHLQAFYSNMDKIMQEKKEEADKIEDRLEKLLFMSDTEVELLTELKNKVDDLFNENITEAMFGDCVPSVERYFNLFEAISPFIKEAVSQQNKIISEVNQKYGLDRITAKSNIAGISEVLPVDQ